MGSHVLLLFIFGPSQPIIGHRRGGGGQRPTVEQASRKAKTSFFWPKRSSGGGGADQQKLLGMPSSNSFVEELSWRLTTNWAYAIGHQKRWKLMTGPNWLHSAEWNERSSPFHWAVGPEESENSKKKGEQVPFFISFRSSGPWPFLESQQLSLQKRRKMKEWESAIAVLRSPAADCHHVTSLANPSVGERRLPRKLGTKPGEAKTFQEEEAREGL